MGENEKAKIACIVFVYSNGELIKLLKERGRALRLGNTKKVQQTEEKISKLMKEERWKFIRPVAAFVTFQE